MSDGARGTGAAFLADLAHPARSTIDASRVTVVVAHPDDETLGLGGQLARLRGVTLLHVTDGAPRNGEDAVRHGFATRETYAAARQAELDETCALAGVSAGARVALGYLDGEAVRSLVPLARRLANVATTRGTTLFLTHAFEGGHPDHDACAFAVHAAARLTGLGTGAVVEMPFYHLGDGGEWVRGRFAPRLDAPLETTLPLDEPARRLKGRMMAAHVTQSETLRHFPVDAERFRVAPAYDFTVLPNGGRLLYERYGWGGVSGAEWLDLSGAALAELGFFA